MVVVVLAPVTVEAPEDVASAGAVGMDVGDGEVLVGVGDKWFWCWRWGRWAELWSWSAVRFPPASFITALTVQPGVDPSLCRPPGSEMVLADTGATGHYVASGENMFDVMTGENIPLNQRCVQIGSGTLLDVEMRGTLIFDFHQFDSTRRRQDKRVRLSDVSLVPGLEFNLFSLHAVSAAHRISIDQDGIHLFDSSTFPHGRSGASLYATRISSTQLEMALSASNVPPGVPPIPPPDGGDPPGPLPPPSLGGGDGGGGAPRFGFPPIGSADVVHGASSPLPAA